jgi:hypothetical protein
MKYGKKFSSSELTTEGVSSFVCNSTESKNKPLLFSRLCFLKAYYFTKTSTIQICDIESQHSIQPSLLEVASIISGWLTTTFSLLKTQY